MKIDLDQLHAHFAGRSGGKRSGRSVALCAQVLGTLWFMHEGQSCIIIAQDSRMGHFLYCLVADVAQGMGMEVSHADRTKWELHFKGCRAFVRVVTKERATPECLRSYGDKNAATVKIAPLKTPCQALCSTQTKVRQCLQIAQAAPCFRYQEAGLRLVISS